jgi:NitT/TauT family transport system permease protein
MNSRFARILVPLLVGIAFLALWEGLVRASGVKPFVLPAPTVIAESLVQNFASLMASLWVTFRVTLAAFLLAVVGGVGLAIVFSQNRLIETALFPYAVALQVTPVISIAPLIIIWVGYDRVEIAVLILAWIVAFFPILSNTTLGLRSADHNLRDLFRLYGANRRQVLTELQLPSALPYILAGMKISGGGRRVRGGLRCCNGSGLADRRSGQPARHSAHVRRPLPAIHTRDMHFLRADLSGTAASAALARERDAARDLMQTG